ncbi:MAG: AbrB/MazE/SpoVT family DNA-binding domain-containing protein [Rhizobium sp.]|nr:AbrB/MazE/SpoVT family DNA-binding domain-containing protein [Rhizobium sp.]MBX9456386.1 AbrB/MazE/SpoVT family DNA-binding domain-containing protein [Rhizobium sp.]
MRVTSKGQVTIPRDMRELAGIKPNSEVLFSIEGGKLTVVPKHESGAVEEKARLERFLETLDRLEGTGDQDVDAATLMSMTRDR